ncbi:hypothetical protein ADK74_32110 [Streptomyces decoyicus]|nr:hypothetical protein ADK74_32110 [Streptomyces decoyicus]
MRVLRLTVRRPGPGRGRKYLRAVATGHRPGTPYGIGFGTDAWPGARRRIGGDARTDACRQIRLQPGLEAGEGA